MAGKLGRFQSQTFNYWKGLTKANHLGAIMQASPQQATNLMVQLLALYRGKTLDSLVSRFPTKLFDTDDEYTWQVVGSTRRNIPLVEARTSDGTTVEATSGMIGAGTTPFYLVFAEDWFSKGEVIVGNLNEVYPMRVLDDPRLEGTNVVYRVECFGGNTDKGIPAERLLAGERFSIEYTPVERAFSRRVGDIHFGSPVSMRNEFSQIRIHTKVPGNMLGKKIAFGIPVVEKDGSKHVENMWMHYVQWQLEQEWSDQKNKILAFGTTTRNGNGEYKNFGVSGEVIRQGSGLYEQMEVANTFYYNNFSLKLIEDALYELSAAKLDFGQRTFVLRTGEIGAMLFHKAVLQDISGWTTFTLDNSSTGVIRKTSSPLHDNSLSAGFQFTEFRAPNGVIVKVEVDSYYDEPVRNKVTIKGHPAMSSRFDIFDIGSMDQPKLYWAA